MIRFIQSYAAPDSIGESSIFKMVSAHFNGNVIPIPFYCEKVRGLSLSECCKFSFNNYKEAKSGDILFGWGADLALLSWLRSKFGGAKNI